MIDIKDITTYQAGIYQARGFRALRHLKNKVLEPYGLTMMQWFVLGLVKDAGKKGVRTTTLANDLDTTQAFITNTVNFLEAKKLISRKPDKTDSRAHSIILNSRYNDLVDKIESELRAELKRTVYQRVSREELQTYINVLYKFSKY